MAEKYGTIPKRFTKDWWDYFWTYYKWHTIIIIVLIAAIAGTVYSKMTAEKFDITLTYAGNGSFSQELSDKLESQLSPMCLDIDNNGEPNLYFSQINLLNSESDPEYAMAMSAKLQMCFAEDETYIFILDKEVAEAYAGEQADECVFAPIDDWLKSDTSGMELFSAHGKNYGIELSDCKFFTDLNLDLSDHYLVMRYYPRKDQMKKQLDGYNGAVELANKILE